MPKPSKRYTALAAKVEDRSHEPTEAIELVKANANARFDETVEAHVRLGIDPKYTCLLYTSPSPRDRQKSRMPSSA